MCIRAVTLATLVSALAAGEEVKGRGTSIDDGPKFNVQLLNGALRRPPAGRSIVMTKKNGKRYRCHLPSTSTSGAAEETSGTPPSTPPLTSYLQQLKNTCFYRLEGWWTYEFCYRQSFRPDLCTTLPSLLKSRVRGRPGGEIGATATFIFIQPRCCVKWCLIHTWHEMRVNSSDMFASKAL